MINIMKFCIFLIQVIIMSIIVSIGWIALEMVVLGHTNPNGIDTVITYILSISLVYNAKFLYKMRRMKRIHEEKVWNRY